MIASALDRMSGGADDNDAQANHIIPVGLGKDTSVSGTLGKKGVGGGGFGLDREGAMVVEGSAPAAPLVASTLTSGANGAAGRRREDDENIVVPTLRSGNAVRNNSNPVTEAKMLVTSAVAPCLRSGEHHNNSDPTMEAQMLVMGRRAGGDEPPIDHGGQVDAIVFNLRGREDGSQPEVDPDGLASLRASSGGSSRSYVAVAENARLDSDDDVSETVTSKWKKGSGGPSGDECGNLVDDRAVGFNWQSGGDVRHVFCEGESPTLQTEQVPAVHVKDAKAIWENQQAHVWETDYTNPMSTGGGKSGQGYAAARITREDGTQFVRRLTPTECERLQGFPDGWTYLEDDSLAGAPSWYDTPLDERDGPTDELKPDGRRYAAMGDAVTVPTVQWIAARILDVGEAREATYPSTCAPEE